MSSGSAAPHATGPLSPADPVPAITGRILAFLDRAEVPYRVVHHGPTYTSEESARARGEALSSGAKALVLRVQEGDYRLVVLRPTSRLDSKKVRRLFGSRRVRFATPEELMKLTGLVPGSVPPFGPPILDLPLTVDAGLEIDPTVAFNAGDLCTSVVMKTCDYLSSIGDARRADLTRAEAPE